MSDPGSAGRPTIMVCITCRTAQNVPPSLGGQATLGGRATAEGGVAQPGVALADATALAAAGAADIAVQRVRCLGNCNRGSSAAIRGENTWTYVFGGLDPTRDGPALVQGARLLAQATDGIMPWRERPESLKRGLIARIPPMNFREEPS